jgi:hypothetical protein
LVHFGPSDKTCLTNFDESLILLSYSSRFAQTCTNLHKLARSWLGPPKGGFGEIQAIRVRKSAPVFAGFCRFLPELIAQRYPQRMAVWEGLGLGRF